MEVWKGLFLRVSLQTFYSFSFSFLSVMLLQKVGCDETIVGDNGTAAAVAHANVRHLLSKV